PALALPAFPTRRSADLQRARQFAEHGQKAEAIKAATELTKTFEGTLAGREGAQLLAVLTAKANPADPQRATRARDMLALAKEDLDRKSTRLNSSHGSSS